MKAVLALGEPVGEVAARGEHEHVELVDDADEVVDRGLAREVDHLVVETRQVGVVELAQHHGAGHRDGGSRVGEGAGDRVAVAARAPDDQDLVAGEVMTRDHPVVPSPGIRALSTMCRVQHLTLVQGVRQVQSAGPDGGEGPELVEDEGQRGHHGDHDELGPVEPVAQAGRVVEDLGGQADGGVGVHQQGEQGQPDDLAPQADHEERPVLAATTRRRDCS